MTLIINSKLLINNKLVKKDILINKNKIIKISNKIDQNKYKQIKKIIDAKNNLTIPGLIDVHVHWREPGFTHKETIKNGSYSAAKGGFTTVMTMPNLNPVTHDLKSLNVQLDIIKKDSIIKAIPYGSISYNLEGNKLSDMTQIKDYVFAFSDDGKGIQNANLMYKAMLKAKSLNKPIVAHCEDETFINSGHINEGNISKKLNIKGMSFLSETVHIARDLVLAKETKCHYHICHVSSKHSLELIKDAKNKKIKVTCEVSPHHLISCDEDISSNNGNWKMNPPLRTKDDRYHLIKGIKNKTIDIIATDHAPHAENEKDVKIEEAAFGVIGSEFAFGLLYTKLVLTKILNLNQIVDLMTKNVSQIFKLKSGVLKEKHVADIAIVDLNKSEIITKEWISSNSKNTPYINEKIFGINMLTICDGKIVYCHQDFKNNIKSK
ncbi:dihydroorotase [Malacoplasma iowae]|uniref:dihydroorotase n=1 Tax=Malacoplasma iowae TaxID=2116 RepID=UPI003873031B|nr:dihydroorotase [Malacoplasma iowae]WPL41323.1 dihydroorotase [Malacoplasma iowae]